MSKRQEQVNATAARLQAQGLTAEEAWLRIMRHSIPDPDAVKRTLERAGKAS